MSTLTPDERKRQIEAHRANVADIITRLEAIHAINPAHDAMLAYIEALRDELDVRESDHWREIQKVKDEQATLLAVANERLLMCEECWHVQIGHDECKTHPFRRSSCAPSSS